MLKTEINSVLTKMQMGLTCDSRYYKCSEILIVVDKLYEYNSTCISVQCLYDPNRQKRPHIKSITVHKLTVTADWNGAGGI